MFKLVAMQECGEKATEGYPAHFVFAVSVSVQGIARTVQLRPRQTMELGSNRKPRGRTVYQQFTHSNQYMYADCNEQSVSRLRRACAYATSYTSLTEPPTLQYDVILRKSDETTSALSDRYL
jgi:hypothetical protein